MHAWWKTTSSQWLPVLREITASVAMRRTAFFLLPYLGVLVGLDVAAHYGAVTDAHLPVQFFFSQDRSFGEYIEYAFTGSIAIMLLIMWSRTKAVVYLSNAMLFAWLTADNALEFHEKFGLQAATLLPTPERWPVEVNHIAEAMLFGVVGALWLAGMWISLRSAQVRQVINSLILAGCIVIAAFFGVVVDMAVVWGEHTAWTAEFLTWLEDGGEFGMICLSFFLALGIFDCERRSWRAGHHSKAI